MHLTRIARTATFQLAVLYAIVFGTSVLALGAVVFLMTASALQRQINSRIEVTSSALVAEFRSGGLKALQSDLQQRLTAPTRQLFQYRLSTGDTMLINNIDPSIVATPGWQTVPADGSASARESSLTVLTVRLDEQSLLSVARRPSAIRDFGQALLEVVGWTLAVTILLGLGGGLFVSSRFLSRVDSITSTAQAIIGGDLRQRIEVRPANDDLDRLARTLNAMLDRINELMERLRHASNDVAHDLRTPLARMRHRLEAAMSTAQTNDQLTKTISQAIVDTDDILETFSALLRIAQIETGTRRSAFVQLDFAGLVHNVVEAYAPSMQDEGKFLSTFISGDVVLVGDRELLTQLVANLLENALRHTAAGTAILVSLKPSVSEIILSVSDTGPGVPEAVRDRLFDRFFRLDRSRMTPGSGLGLSLIKAIAELHGAEIAITDNCPGLRVDITFHNGVSTTEGSRGQRPA